MKFCGDTSFKTMLIFVKLAVELLVLWQKILVEWVVIIINFHDNINCWWSWFYISTISKIRAGTEFVKKVLYPTKAQSKKDIATDVYLAARIIDFFGQLSTGIGLNLASILTTRSKTYT